MLSPRKVDGRWGSPPGNDAKYMQHRPSKAKDSKRDTLKEKSGSIKPKSSSTSKSGSRRNTMTQKPQQTNEKDAEKNNKQPEKSRKEAVYDAKMNLLFNDFFVMLDSSPLPEEAFDIKSQEYRYASQWINKLMTMKCGTLLEGRIRNAYMSALSVCFNQKRLYGIFDQMPPDELEWIDFADTSHHGSLVQETVANCAMQVTSKMMQQFASMGGPHRSFDPFRGLPQHLIEHTRGLGRPQFVGEQRQQQEQQFQAQLQVQAESLRLVEQTQTFYDPLTFPAPPHAAEQSGPHQRPSQVKFDTFGSPPRFIAGNVEGRQFNPSGQTIEDLGNAFKESPSSSAAPKRSILKRRSSTGTMVSRHRAKPTHPKAAVSFNEKKYFDDEIWTKSPIHSYRMEFAKAASSSKYKSASNATKMKFSPGPREDEDADGEGSEDFPVEQAIKGSMQEEHGFKKSSQKAHQQPTMRQKSQGTQTKLSRSSDMSFLMKCIHRELSGETSEGADAYMESELVNYRQFVSQHRCNDAEFKKKMNRGDPIAERIYLLINMQADLTKLMSLERREIYKD
ncbi:uncharacterized protein LOC111067573 [Drosophila obscura]|uniref:uncharacterized protein LOC111067573 n=1 Tax=Drosophila obscura TaxID=7282 RepID=UPI001BB1EB5A|nr:uncharacterized protein LOC111067573 [Drosophila obscura]